MQKSVTTTNESLAHKTSFVLWPYPITLSLGVPVSTFHAVDEVMPEACLTQLS